MKYGKMLGLAAMALMAFGAGSASAAELYSTKETVPQSTEISGSLESGSSALLTTTDGSTNLDTCTLSGFSATHTTGEGEAPVTGSISSLLWSECSFTTDTLTSGSLSIAGNGAVSGSGTVVTVNIGVSCRYGTGGGTTLGTLNAGKLAINAVINEQEPKTFLCPDTTKWVANYVVTNPHDLTVEADVVKVELEVPEFKEGERKVTKAKNSGNVEWDLTEEIVAEQEEGTWESFGPCKPFFSVLPGNSCSREFKCKTKGKKLHWIIKVKSPKGLKTEAKAEGKCT